MKISVQTLTKLLPALKLVAGITPWKVDDMVVMALERIAGDEDLMDKLAEWLNWTKLFGAGPDDAMAQEPELPACLEDLRPALEKWRDHLKDCDCDNCDG